MRANEPLSPRFSLASFPQSSSGNLSSALPLDARLKTAGMTELEQTVHGQEGPIFSGAVSKRAGLDETSRASRVKGERISLAALLWVLRLPVHHGLVALALVVEAPALGEVGLVAVDAVRRPRFRAQRRMPEVQSEEG